MQLNTIVPPPHVQLLVLSMVILVLNQSVIIIHVISIHNNNDDYNSIQNYPVRMFSVDDRNYPPLYEDEWTKDMNNNICWYRLITSITRFPCYREPLPITSCQCASMSYNRPDLHITYALPSTSSKETLKPYDLTQQQLQDQVIINFIHVNKAAGTTFKHILFDAAEIGKWDGIGLGTQFGWHFRRVQTPYYLVKTQQQLMNSSISMLNQIEPDSLDYIQSQTTTGYVDDSSSEIRNSPRPEEILYIRCGTRHYSQSDMLQMYLTGGWYHFVCPIRLVWGSGSMGLCDHFPGKPCITILTLRDPLTRALSDYTYFCTEGQEKRKKWDRGWKSCRKTPVEWFKEMRTSPYLYVERLTLGCDRGCGLQVALANLKHPCVRYIITEQFDDGLRKLKHVFGSSSNNAMAQALHNYLHNPTPQNVHSSSSSASSTSSSNTKNNDNGLKISDEEKNQLVSMLGEDYVIYHQAVEFYERSWNRKIQSCNIVL
jgi:hypothetical protein